MNADLSALTDTMAVITMLAQGLANGLLLLITTWWGITVLVTVAVVAVTGYAPGWGFTDYDDSTPFLTEREREVAHQQQV